MDVNKTFDFKLITPSGVLFDGKADFVAFRAETGDMAVMAGHSPITTVVGNGELRILNGSETHTFTVDGGFAEVNENGTFTILSGGGLGGVAPQGLN